MAVDDALSFPQTPARGKVYKASPALFKVTSSQLNPIDNTRRISTSTFTTTMKIAALGGTFTLALLPSVSAWRVYFYQLKNEGDGPYITNGGPGNPGYKCHSNVDPLNQKISSMRYYSDNPEGTTRCCIRLYDSPGCKNDFGYEFCRNQFVNFDDIGHDNDVSSYSTNCVRI